MRFRRSPSYAHPWFSSFRAAAYRVGMPPLQAPAAESVRQGWSGARRTTHSTIVSPTVSPIGTRQPLDTGKDDDMRAPVSLCIAAAFALAAALAAAPAAARHGRSEAHTSELQSLM